MMFSTLIITYSGLSADGVWARGGVAVAHGPVQGQVLVAQRPSALAGAFCPAAAG